MQKENAVVKKQVILNAIQDLQRLSLQLVNSMRGRSRIKYGMTALFNNGGFTLIELLVVVLIIAILAAVAVPQYQVAVAKSRYAKLKTLVKSIEDAEIVYYLANGKYVANFTKLDIDLPSGKLDTSSAGRYEYDWGLCDVGIDESSKFWFGCTNDKIKMRYQMYLPQRTRLCYTTVRRDDSVQAKICRQETNNTPTKGTSFWTWHYKTTSPL